MTREQRTLQLMKAGWTTALDSALKGGVLSLSQRVGEWRKVKLLIRVPGLLVPQLHQIEDRWQKTASGAKVKAYRLVRVK